MYELRYRLKFGNFEDQFSVRNIEDKGVCDWFILCQIAKNAQNPQRFNTFMQQVVQIRQNGETIGLQTIDRFYSVENGTE